MMNCRGTELEGQEKYKSLGNRENYKKKIFFCISRGNRNTHILKNGKLNILSMASQYHGLTRSKEPVQLGHPRDGLREANGKLHGLNIST